MKAMRLVLSNKMKNINSYKKNINIKKYKKNINS